MQYRLIGRAAPEIPPVDLDDAQRVVVEHDAGALLVLAGPGTGKTTTLVESVAHRVGRGVPIEDILVLTFAQRAAGELRDRIAARLDATIREPVARTFHSYAFGLLRLAAESDTPLPRLLAGAEQDVMIRELLAGELESGSARWPSFVQPALRTRGFATELRDVMLRAIERDLDGADLRRLGAAHHRPDWSSAGRFLDEYLQVTALQRPGAYDAAELIGAAIDALERDPALLARERARRRRIFVDEYQDTDPAQTYLLNLVAHGADELILVGDPDQSIYAFRGADAHAMGDAGRRLGRADLPVVALHTCRRSGPVLVAASRRIAANLSGPAAHRSLQSAPGARPGSVDVLVLRSRNEEAAAVAAALRRAHLDEGVPWSRMAVIVRSTSRSAAVLRRAMLVAGVPVTVAATDLPLAEQSAISQLLAVLRCVAEPAHLDDEVATTLLLGPIGDADAMYLRRLDRELRALAVAAGGDPDADLRADALRDAGLVATLPINLRHPLARVQRVLVQGGTALAADQGVEDVLWAIWHESGLGQLWERQSAGGGSVGAAADRNLDAVIELFAAAARLADRLPGASVQALYEHVAAQQIPGDSWRAGVRERDAVQILTAHASKGLEWDVVCVAGVQEGGWPDLRRRGSLLGADLLVDVAAGLAEVSGLSRDPLLTDERRLFYVAITRARYRLMVTAARGEDEQPSRFLDELDPVEDERPLSPVPRALHLPAVVAELRRTVTDAGAADTLRLDAAQLLAQLAEAGVPGADPDQWWGLAASSDDRGVVDDDAVVTVSPSTIDSYLTCALRTFLEAAGARIDQSPKAALGSVVHEIAEVVDAAADLATLEAQLDQRWGALDFGAAWYGRRERERASTMLARLWTWLHEERPGLALVAREQPFSVAVGTDGQTVLRGTVDRLERDGRGQSVIVDFKTSGSKVPAGKLDQHPQLSAYQLAAQLGAFAADGLVGEPAGAWLVQLGAKGPITQKQPPLSATADPAWVRTALETVASLQRGARFDAHVNTFCQQCAVRRLCPAQHGDQVTR